MTAVAGRHIHVSRLGLRAPEARDVAGFRNDLDDALRTATLPDQASGSLLHIRRLDLGKLRRGLSRQALSAHITQVLRQTPVHVLRWGAPPPPPMAQVVLLSDVVTAAAFALAADLDGTPQHPAVVLAFPHLAVAASPTARMVETLGRLIAATSAAGPGRIAELAGGLDLMIRVLDALPAPARAGFAPPGLGPGPRPPDAAASEPSRDHLDAPSGSPVAAAPRRPTPAEIVTATAGAPRAVTQAALRLIPLWGPTDLRTATLLTWIATASEGPSGATRMPARLARMAAVAGGARSTAPPSGTPDRPVKRRRPKVAARPAPASPRPPFLAPPATETAAAPPPKDPVPEPIPRLDGVPHAFAGFWFLIPVLRHIGCSEAERALDLPLVRATLARFAARLGLRDGDPIRDLVDPLACDLTGPLPAFGPSDTVLSLLAGTRGLWAAETGPCTALSLRRSTPFFAQPATASLPPLRLHAAADPIRDPVTGMSLAAQRLVSRTLHGRGWRWLVARPGRLLVTPTHIDVTFDGATTDIDVRMAGFDLNPGWVPELGRVVAFHYDYSAVRDHEGWGHE